MTQDEYRAQAYRLGHRFVRKLLGLGKTPDTIRRAIDRAQEHLLTLGAYSAELDRMKGFFAYPPEKVYSRPCLILADGAEGVPSRHLVCSVDGTSGLCPAELTRPEPVGAAA
jgi:hypothetical protein